MKSYFLESLFLHLRLAKDAQFQEALAVAIDRVVACLQGERKILIAGNGGSAAEAQHFAAELVGRYQKERRAFAAIALTTDTSAITAISNDYSFDRIFSRQVEALGTAGDVLVVFSTSGNSKNILEAITVARQRGLFTIGLLGNEGGLAKHAVDLALVVPSPSTPRIQEAHQLLVHIISEEVERRCAFA